MFSISSEDLDNTFRTHLRPSRMTCTSASSQAIYRNQISYLVILPQWALSLKSNGSIMTFSNILFLSSTFKCEIVIPCQGAAAFITIRCEVDKYYQLLGHFTHLSHRGQGRNTWIFEGLLGYGFGQIAKTAETPWRVAISAT